MARTLPISRPSVSQHLKILKDAGLVSERADPHAPRGEPVFSRDIGPLYLARFAELLTGTGG
jgi:DNA-binding transcriptional ArsR family regulator